MRNKTRHVRTPARRAKNPKKRRLKKLRLRSEAAADALVRLSIPTLHSALGGYKVGSKKFVGLMQAIASLVHMKCEADAEEVRFNRKIKRDMTKPFKKRRVKMRDLPSNPYQKPRKRLEAKRGYPWNTCEVKSDRWKKRRMK